MGENASRELIAPLGPADPSEDAPELYTGTVARAQSAWREAEAQIKSAIRNGDFQLHCQSIMDLAADVPPFHDIFVRQSEEERNMMPPGAFFELAEEYGLMPELDRWMVSGVLEWISARVRARPGWRPALYFITVARDTIGDPYFPKFVHAQVTASGVPADALCFELLEADVVALTIDAAELVRNLRALGFRTMLGGFGRDRVSLEILKDMRFDFLKLHGSLAFNILRNEASVTKVRSIVRMAHAIGINTVAELVESTETLHKLRELEVDYAQGEAIAASVPLSGLN